MRRLVCFLLLALPSLPLLAGCAGSARKDFDISSIEGTTVFESEKNFDAMTVDGAIASSTTAGTPRPT